MEAEDLAQTIAWSLHETCERLLQLAVACPHASTMHRSIATARAALAVGDDATLRMGCQVLLRCLIPLESTGDAHFIAQVQDARRVLDRHHHLFSQWVAVAVLQSDVINAFYAQQHGNAICTRRVFKKYGIDGLDALSRFAQEQFTGAITELQDRDDHQITPYTRVMGTIFRHQSGRFPWSATMRVSDFMTMIIAAVERQFDIHMGSTEQYEREYEAIVLDDLLGVENIITYALYASSTSAYVVVQCGVSNPRVQVKTIEAISIATALAAVNYLTIYLRRLP